MILGEELQGRGRGARGASPSPRVCARVRVCRRPASGRGHFKVRLPGKRQRRWEGSSRSHQAENSADLGHAPGSSAQPPAPDDNQLSPRQLSLQRAGQAGCGHVFRSRGGRDRRGGERPLTRPRFLCRPAWPAASLLPARPAAPPLLRARALQGHATPQRVPPTASRPDSLQDESSTF